MSTTGFFTRPDLEDRQFRQISGSILTLSGETNFAGILKSKGVEIDASTGGASVGYVLTWDGTKIKLEAGGGTYQGASPSTSTEFEGIPAGTNISGQTYDELWEALLVVYQDPAFTSFSVSSYSSTVEVGTTLSGSRTFTWATSNSGNVQLNSITIRDNTAAVDLGSGLANDGSELLGITTIQLNSNGASQSWRSEGINTQSGSFNSSNKVTTGRYYRFYGPSATSPTNSAEVRALPSSAFQTANVNNFTLNTLTTETKFVVALPPGRTISTVIDITALGTDITSEYISTGTINVLDAGGTNRSYNMYEMNIGGTYGENHEHYITTA